MIAWQPPAGAQTLPAALRPRGRPRASRTARSPAARRCRSRSTRRGLPADVRAAVPAPGLLLGARALAGRARGWPPSLLTGELVVAAYDGAGDAAADHRRADPRRARRPLRAGADARGRSWRPGWGRRSGRRCGGRPSLAVWAPTAKNVDLLLDPAGPRPSSASRCAAATTACGARRATRRGATRPTATRSTRLRAHARQGGHERASPTPTRSR